VIGGIGHHVTIVVNLLCDYGEVVFISCPSISGTSISSAISADTQAPWYCLIDEEAHGRIDGCGAAWTKWRSTGTGYPYGAAESSVGAAASTGRPRARAERTNLPRDMLNVE